MRGGVPLCAVTEGGATWGVIMRGGVMLSTVTGGVVTRDRGKWGGVTRDGAMLFAGVGRGFCGCVDGSVERNSGCRRYNFHFRRFRFRRRRFSLRLFFRCFPPFPRQKSLDARLTVLNEEELMID